jgi:hypothetical protein
MSAQVVSRIRYPGFQNSDGCVLYRENTTEIARRLDQMRSLEPIQGLDVRTFIDIKGEDADEDKY